MCKAAHYSAIGVLLVWTHIAVGAIIYVPGDYPLIQDAIDAANPGDEIEVAPGTYYEAVNFNGRAVRLYSSAGASVTTINGGGAYHVVQCVSGEDAETVLEGFTITGGRANGSGADGKGGGMYNGSGSNPRVIDCTFTGNSAGYGGGMNNWESSPRVTNCTFSSNLASGSGGGMYNWHSNPIVADCTFSSNSGQYGAGMLNYYSNPAVTNCTFTGNSATSGGGGVYNWNGTPTVTNCIFTGNSAIWRGGAMYNALSSPTVNNCIFTGNSAVYGGGMNSSGGSPTVTGCTLTGNSAGYGGGIYSWESGPQVTNCILWSNGTDEISGPASVSYSDVQHGWPGEGNIDADPLFIGGRDLHLQPGSPCIDAGNSTAVTEPHDLDGNARVQGAAVDMGAYEVAPANTPPEILAISVPPDSVQINTMVNVGASFSDIDASDTHIAEWEWGDSTSSTGLVDQASDTVSGSHTYTSAGVYAIILTVTDASDASDEDVYEFVVVYDPTGGFVSGAGSIDSPVGAYVPDPTLTGKANFGFVSRYLKGSAVPTGHTQFRFNAGHLNFHSSRYDWLVVTGSDYARFKGSGTINGSGGFKFMLWAGDGNPDTFRIRIWEEDEATGVETDIYDNGFDQAIGAGSIMIHTK